MAGDSAYCKYWYHLCGDWRGAWFAALRLDIIRSIILASHSCTLAWLFVKSVENCASHRVSGVLGEPTPKCFPSRSLWKPQSTATGQEELGIGANTIPSKNIQYFCTVTDMYCQTQDQRWLESFLTLRPCLGWLTLYFLGFHVLPVIRHSSNQCLSQSFHSRKQLIGD